MKSGARAWLTNGLGLAFHSLTPSFTPPRKFPWQFAATCGGMLLGALGSAGAHEPTAPFERLALRALYESAGGASWGAKGNARWMTGDPCGVPPYYCGQNCEGWAGVHCWGPGGHVRRLEVRHTVGVLPTELGLLTSLAALELPGNRLSGTLPSELGRIPFRRTAADVAALILGGHKLSGTIPLEVALGLPDHLSRCTLPRHLECSPGGVFPPACSRKPTATDGKAACSSHGTAVPVARLCPVPPSRELATTSIGQLCEALAHLGHSHLLPLGSTAEVALRAGFRSVTQFVDAEEAAVSATVQLALGSMLNGSDAGSGAPGRGRRIGRARGSRAYELPRLPKKAARVDEWLVAKHEHSLLEARRALREQAALERAWASASGAFLPQLIAC